MSQEHRVDIEETSWIGQRREWDAICSCGWGSYDNRDPARARAAADKHHSEVGAQPPEEAAPRMHRNGTRN